MKELDFQSQQSIWRTRTTAGEGASLLSEAIMEDRQEDKPVLMALLPAPSTTIQVMYGQRKAVGNIQRPGQTHKYSPCVSNGPSFPHSWKTTGERKMLFRKGEAATHVGNTMGGWTATAEWVWACSCDMSNNIPQHQQHCLSSDREATQKMTALHRFVEYWFILAEAYPWRSGEDHKRKASSLYPAATTGMVHPLGSKDFLLFPFLLVDRGGQEGNQL